MEYTEHRWGKFCQANPPTSVSLAGAARLARILEYLKSLSFVVCWLSMMLQIRKVESILQLDVDEIHTLSPSPWMQTANVRLAWLYELRKQTTESRKSMLIGRCALKGN